MSHQVTYVFRDGKTYALRQGKVIAASTDPDEVERRVAAIAMPPEPSQEAGYPLTGDNSAGMEGYQDCPTCGAPGDPSSGYCQNCGGMLGIRHDLASGGAGDYGALADRLHNGPPPDATYAKVVTPNGVKGTVLGKVAGLWGDEVTIRLENGRIVKLPVGTELRAVKTAATQGNPIERLETRLAVTADGTREGLMARSEALENIKKHAAHLIREGVSWSDTQRLDEIAVVAGVEQEAIKQALAHLDDVESIAAPGFSMGVAHEAAGISREDASWLDQTLDEMIKEAEATDFTKLMDEGPEAFTAELPDVALADVGVTRQMASSFIAEKTAGIAREIAEPYTETFLGRVEQCRRNELSTRVQAIKKEAAAEEDKYKDLPDDAFFL